VVLAPRALAALQELVGDRLRTDRAAIGAYARDASHLIGAVDAVVRPTDATEVAAVVGWARTHRVPLVPRGAGTSLDGESVPGSGVVIDLSQWNEILEIDPVDRIARVRPGVVNFELQQAARAQGLFFPPNPGSWRTSTIGGNVATNASGPRSFRYGPTRSWVREAKVVLGTGERIRVGSRAPKRSIGPDLLQLLVGSEGTLGVFTEITVTLAPASARRAALGVALPTEAKLGPVVAELARGLPDGLTALEYLDRRCADTLARIPGARLPSGDALLLMEVESATETEETERLERLSVRLRGLGIASDPVVFPDADRLWSLRGESGTALDREMGERVREDVCVPVSRLDELLALIELLGRKHGVATCVYGHLGEASVHPNFAVDPTTEAGTRLREEFLRGTLELGGVVSGEHGIGRVKRGLLEPQVGPVGLRMLRALKATCDPDGILNPGKLSDPAMPVSGAGVRPSPSPSGVRDGRTARG
jgi:FAD/FMN-containing dehydrogenase